LAVFTEAQSGATNPRSSSRATRSKERGQGGDLYPSFGGGIFVATHGTATQTFEVKSTNVVRNNKATRGYGGGLRLSAKGRIQGGHPRRPRRVQRRQRKHRHFRRRRHLRLTQTLGLDDDGKVAVRSARTTSPGTRPRAAPTSSGQGRRGILAEYHNEQTSGLANQLAIDTNSLRNNTSESFGGGRPCGSTPTGSPSTRPALAGVVTAAFREQPRDRNLADDTLTDDDLGEGGGVFVDSQGLAAAPRRSTASSTPCGQHGGHRLGRRPGDPRDELDRCHEWPRFLECGRLELDLPLEQRIRGGRKRRARRRQHRGTDRLQRHLPERAALRAQYTTIAGPATSRPIRSSTPSSCPCCAPRRSTPETPRRDERRLPEERQPNGAIANLGHTGLTQNAASPSRRHRRRTGGWRGHSPARGFIRRRFVGRDPLQPSVDLDNDARSSATNLSYMRRGRQGMSVNATRGSGGSGRLRRNDDARGIVGRAGWSRELCSSGALVLSCDDGGARSPASWRRSRPPPRLRRPFT